MGILNVTPDSFSDGGRWSNAESAVVRGLQMVEQGADLIDVGGESTRPGAAAVSVEEELNRVIPVVRELAKQINVPISVDTSRPEVIHRARDAGATLINDVRGFRAPGALEAVASSDMAVCIMHMQGEPRTMQTKPEYQDVVAEVKVFLEERITECRNVGIATERIMVDPGIGFGKSTEHNLSLLSHLDALLELHQPILIGLSRKSLIGVLTGRGIDNRLAGSLALATAAVLAGASIIRAHDVAETVDAVRVAASLKQRG